MEDQRRKQILEAVDKGDPRLVMQDVNGLVLGLREAFSRELLTGNRRSFPCRYECGT